MWDLEFTERKPLDDNTEEELAASGEKAFRTLYQCLLVHAVDQQQSADRDGAQVKLISYRDTLSLLQGTQIIWIICFTLLTWNHFYFSFLLLIFQILNQVSGFHALQAVLGFIFFCPVCQKVNMQRLIISVGLVSSVCLLFLLYSTTMTVSSPFETSAGHTCCLACADSWHSKWTVTKQSDSVAPESHIKTSQDKHYDVYYSWLFYLNASLSLALNFYKGSW